VGGTGVGVGVRGVGVIVGGSGVVVGGGEVDEGVGVAGGIDCVSSRVDVGAMPISMVPVHPVRAGTASTKSQTISLYEPVYFLIIISSVISIANAAAYYTP
jgi:hypothetical protein